MAQALEGEADGVDEVDAGADEGIAQFQAQQVMLGLGGKAIHGRSQTTPAFIDAMNGLYGGRFVPVPGGVLVRDARGTVIGAVGVTGDTSDNDAVAACAGIEAAGFTPEA